MSKLKQWVHKLKNRLIIKLGGYTTPVIPYAENIPGHIVTLVTRKTIPKEVLKQYSDEEVKTIVQQELLENLKYSIIKQMSFSRSLSYCDRNAAEYTGILRIATVKERWDGKND